MIKYYCDACGKEIINRSYDVKILKHITTHNIGYCEIIDGKSQPVSGVDVSQMLCLPCYNEVMYKLWENLEKIRKNNNIIQ